MDAIEVTTAGESLKARLAQIDETRAEQAEATLAQTRENLRPYLEEASAIHKEMRALRAEHRATLDTLASLDWATLLARYAGRPMYHLVELAQQPLDGAISLYAESERAYSWVTNQAAKVGIVSLKAQPKLIGDIIFKVEVMRNYPSNFKRRIESMAHYVTELDAALKAEAAAQAEAEATEPRTISRVPDMIPAQDVPAQQTHAVTN